MRMIYPDWLRAMTRGSEVAFWSDEPVSAGISGGQTSMLLRFLLREHGRAPDLYCGFRNTSEEHSQTYLFLQMADRAGLPSEWAEFRKPLVYGDPPKMLRYEVVTPETAHRNGEVFEWFLETLAEYRARFKGLGSVRPSGAMRLCTAYMKHKVADHICADRWGDVYTTFVGLRADEPDRIAKMRTRDTRDKTNRAPLAEIGITKEHVRRFWREQPFQLGVPDNLGNCQLCFLKDESDLAHNMLYDVLPATTQRWIDRQKKYGNFKERDYATLRDEAPVRDIIRQGLVGGLIPMCPDGFDEYRYRLLVRQERRVMVEGIRRVACNCEASELLTDEMLLEMSA